MIVLIDGVRYRLVTPESEAWLEKAIQSNCDHIFGPDSFYLDIKKMIRSKAGVASIPDGYVIFFTPKPRWAIVEVELASHPIYDHVVTQLTKFNRGIEDILTRKRLVEVLYEVFNDDEVLRARLKQKLQTGEIFKFISDLVSENPLIVVAIDQKTEELKEALKDIRGEVEVVEFRTFRREGVSADVNAFVFDPMFSEPVLDTRNETDGKERGADKYGYRLGSDRAKINAVLSTEPKTMKTLVQEAGLSDTYYQHLKRLVEKGFVEKTDKGFREIVGRKKVIAVSEDVGYSEFWEPIRREGLFKGKPVPIRDEAWVAKGVRGILVELILQDHKCLVQVSCKGEDRLERRRNIIRLFPKNEYEYKVHESPKSARVRFPVLDKGKKDREHWPEMREKLTKLGTDIYNKMEESGV